MTDHATTQDQTTLRRTPLHDEHVALGGKMVPFAGYEMPVQYPAGITAEHRAVRERVGLFDVSHMGEFIVRGPDAIAYVNHLTSNDVSALTIGQAQYSGILNDRGTFEDDCLVYRFPDHLMVVVNASNREKDFAHFQAHQAGFDVSLDDMSDHIALLALQGPDAQRVLTPHTSADLDTIGYYHFVVGTVAGVTDVVISRTGYTGEDGFELYLPAEHAATVWRALTATAEVTPAGLGARDSLRLEMGMALYGNDIDDTTTPYEAGLGWIVKLKKGNFVGRDALEQQKAAGAQRKLVGFRMSEERAFPRHGYPVWYDGNRVGEVRSGTMSPSLGVGIGTAYVPTAAAVEGTQIEIEIRGRRVPATVEKAPFYKGASHR